MPTKVRIMHRGRKRSARAGFNGKFPRYVRVTAEQFRDARVFAGLDRDQAAELLHVSVRTVGHWETGKARPSYAAFRLLRVYRHGDLIDPAWSGYKLSRGRLVTPEGHAFVPGDMAWLSLLVRRAAAFSDLRQARDRATPAEGRAVTEGANGALATVAITGDAPVDVSRHEFPQQAGAASAASQPLGLVYSSTTHNLAYSPDSVAVSEGPSLGATPGHVDGLTTACIQSATFSPVDPVESPGSNTGQKGSQSAHGGLDGGSQRSSRGRSQAGGSKVCGTLGHQSQRSGVSRSSRLPRQPQSPGRASCLVGTSGAAAETAAAARRSRCGTAARRPKRPMSLRQRSEGQAVPPGELLTPGGVA
jgi:DNA-binding transcriptional regulator YiaG